MSTPVEVSIVEKPGGGEWRVWLCDPSGKHATVEPQATVRNEEALKAWTEGYQWGRERTQAETHRAQRQRGKRRGPERR